MLGTFATFELLPNFKRAGSDFLGGSPATFADSDTRNWEVSWGQKAPRRTYSENLNEPRMLGTSATVCHFEGVPRMSLGFGGHLGARRQMRPPPRVLRTGGDGLGRRARSQKIPGREQPPGFCGRAKDVPWLQRSLRARRRRFCAGDGLGRPAFIKNPWREQLCSLAEPTVVSLSARLRPPTQQR